MKPSAPVRTHDFLYKESKRAKLEREKEERRKRREVEIEFAPEVSFTQNNYFTQDKIGRTLPSRLFLVLTLTPAPVPLIWRSFDPSQ